MAQTNAEDIYHVQQQDAGVNESVIFTVNNYVVSLYCKLR